MGGKVQSTTRSNLDSGGAVAIGGDVMADVFKTALEEVTFREFERHLILGEDLADAVQVVQQGGDVAGEQQDVVDDDTATFVGGVGVKGVEQRVPLVLQLPHHGSVYGWGIHGPERHDLECVLFSVGAEEGQLLLIEDPNADLVVALTGVQTNKPQSPKTVSEVVYRIIAAGNGIFKCAGDAVQLPI